MIHFAAISAPEENTDRSVTSWFKNMLSLSDIKLTLCEPILVPERVDEKLTSLSVLLSLDAHELNQQLHFLLEKQNFMQLEQVSVKFYI